MNSNENKTTPPVELTDEEMEQAAGGTNGEGYVDGRYTRVGGGYSYYQYCVKSTLVPWKCELCGVNDKTYAAGVDYNYPSDYPGKFISLWRFTDCKCYSCDYKLDHSVEIIPYNSVIS